MKTRNGNVKPKLSKNLYGTEEQQNIFEFSVNPEPSPLSININWHDYTLHKVWSMQNV